MNGQNENAFPKARRSVSADAALRAEGVPALMTGCDMRALCLDRRTRTCLLRKIQSLF